MSENNVKAGVRRKRKSAAAMAVLGRRSIHPDGRTIEKGRG